MQILVLGKNGQLGQTFQILSGNEEGQWTFLDKSKADLTHVNFREQLSKLEFDILINCAAYTAVDKAESEVPVAFQINALAVGKMAEVCLEKQALLIHFSTDYVYHNDVREPLKESDPTLPIGIYAKSKLEGENQILASGCKYLIFRTSWVISPYANNFVKTMIRLAGTTSTLKIVSDQTGAPTFAEDLAQAVCQIIRRYQENPDAFTQFGIYNYSNEGQVTWHELAVEIFQQMNKKIEVIPISTQEFNAPATRPQYSILSKEKIRKTFGIEIPQWKDALTRCLKQLSSN